MKVHFEPNPAKLQKIMERELKAEDILLHYTGNMYGIGCRASQVQSIKKMFDLKKRSINAGMIALVPDLQWFAQNGIELPPRLMPIVEQYWPGNLTIVIKTDYPPLAHISKDSYIAFRVPTDQMLREMIHLMGEPLISTSINISSLPPEEDFDKIKRNYSHWFDMAILPHPKHTDPNADPSTVIQYLQAEDHKDGRTELKCLREGSIPFYEIKKSFELPLVMFVCTANVCRSPMADYLFNHYIKKEGLHYIGDSSGLLESGRMISVNSLQMLLMHGITEAQLHISQQITPQLVSKSWLILTMEQRQRDHLKHNAPGATHKIFTLNEIVGESGDIEDPYGSDLESYEITYNIIDDRIKRLINMIKENKIYTRI